MNRLRKNSRLIIPLLTATSSILIQAPLKGDLIARYEFEENGDDSIGDANGDVGENVSFGEGAIGFGAVFGTSGTQPLDTINVVPAFDPGEGNFTVAFWVRRDQMDVDNADGVFDALAGTGVGYQSNFRNTPDLNKMGFRLDASNGAFVLIVDPDPTEDAGVWHHFALVVDRAGQEAKIYKDGIEKISADISSLVGNLSPTQDMWIGGLDCFSKMITGPAESELHRYEALQGSG